MSGRFPHHRLIVYRKALELAGLAHEICSGVPAKHRAIADQLIRSGSAVVLLIAEGAGRYSAAQKRQRFVEARGECGEASAAVEVLLQFGSAREPLASQFQGTAEEVGAMLCALVQRHS